jgi:hypothetical protein
MKYLRSIPAKKKVAIGMLLVVLPTLFNDVVPIPQFVSGFVMGLGLAVEIVATMKLKREKANANCSIVNDGIL